MVLAHLFVQAGFKVGMAHVNYGMRGEESNKDEQLVFEAAVAWAQTFHRTHYFENRSTGNFQEKARNFRYTWFSSLMEENGYNCLAIAHHADDQIETFFFEIASIRRIKGIGRNQSQRWL